MTVPKAVATGRRVAMVLLAIAVVLTLLGIVLLVGIMASQPVTV
jgi:hypothetical protein